MKNQSVFIALLFCLLINTLPSLAQCDHSINLAYGKPAVASSLENGSFPASNAFDGDATGSRWSSAYSDPQYIYVDLGSSLTLCEVEIFWEAAYGSSFTIDISNNAATWTTAASISGNASQHNIISISGTGRYVRMSGITRGSPYGYSIYEMKVYGTSSIVCNGTNLALNHTATASSLEAAGYPASYAVDGNNTTRWSSAFSDPQYLYVDLGSVHNICQVYILWENAYGSAYTIDLSNDASSWTTATTVSGNASTTNLLNITGSGRYLRMRGTSRATGYGYSIYELQVTDQATLPVKFAYFKAGADGHKTVLQWATASESNSAYFDVQRSADGRNYVSIGHVAAAGNSNTRTDYSYTDANPLSGMNYYRLLQTDLDGKGDYSSVVTTNMGSTVASSINYYPNPMGDQLTLQSKDGRILREAYLYNTAGIQLYGARNAGGGVSMQVPTNGLPAGLYLLKVVTDKDTELLKLAK
ncbi:MAG: discoidin domain-containing protein [Bacteroidetes bacterium]|nr:discoidin domain-containing protein [Bacteroidota bacterium]